MDYKFRKNAGALNELAAPASSIRARASYSQTNAMPQAAMRMPSQAPLQQQTLTSILEENELDYAAAHNTGVTGLAVAEAPVHAQTVGTRGMARPATPGGRPGSGTGLDRTTTRGARSMFFYTVQEGQRAQVIDSGGRIEIVEGPRKIFWWGKRVEPMQRYVAHPGEFLIVRFRDGRQEHRAGPANVWFDPREHLEVTREDALQIAAKEAVVVYARDEKDGTVTRRIVHGPATFVPAAGEWLHTFSWHGSRGASHGYEKVPNALVFQKLWLMPDQMYHDVPDVRTSDDAVLTIRLMLFFELADVEKMLETTHDPIGDFVNAATSDVVDFVARHDLDGFKKHTDRLNELGAYPQLVARGAQCGYRINKVVYRGYGAPDNLQRMHDEAIESRTRLQLERATQEQAHDLEDAKQTRAMARAAREREAQRAQIEHQVEQEKRQREGELANELARREFVRAQEKLDEETRRDQRTAQAAAERAHLEGLRSMGVDLTKLLAERRPDQVLEVRGGANGATHLHVSPTEGRR